MYYDWPSLGRVSTLLGLPALSQPHGVGSWSSPKKGHDVAEQIKIITFPGEILSDHVVVEAMKMQDYVCFRQSYHVRT